MEDFYFKYFTYVFINFVVDWIPSKLEISSIGNQVSVRSRTVIFTDSNI